MEERVNNQLKEISIPDFAKFMAEFKLAQTNFAELKRQTPSTVFDSSLVISDEKESF